MQFLVPFLSLAHSYGALEQQRYQFKSFLFPRRTWTYTSAKPQNVTNLLQLSQSADFSAAFSSYSTLHGTTENASFLWLN